MKRRIKRTLKELTALPPRRLQGMIYTNYTNKEIIEFRRYLVSKTGNVNTTDRILYMETGRVLRNRENLTALEYATAPLREALDKTDTRSIKIRGL